MLNHRAMPPKSKQIFQKKKTKIVINQVKKKIYKLNCQSSSFPLSASPVTYPSKPIIGNFRLLFVFLIASSCFSERLRLGFVRLWTVLLRWCFGSIATAWAIASGGQGMEFQAALLWLSISCFPFSLSVMPLLNKYHICF